MQQILSEVTADGDDFLNFLELFTIMKKYMIDAV